jgi:hypothetical protein
LIGRKMLGKAFIEGAVAMPRTLLLRVDFNEWLFLFASWDVIGLIGHLFLVMAF